MITIDDLDARIEDFSDASKWLMASIKKFSVAGGNKEKQKQFKCLKQAAATAIEEARIAIDGFQDELEFLLSQ
ncbi:MAG: hypothetical protein WC805_03460 [Patescibacteria group bacterium]|jgi:hypothetical protein